MSVFIFDDTGGSKAVHRGKVPAGIESKAALLDGLSAALRFPDYFGKNWDALDECLGDLSWLPPGDVILSHEDLPLSKDRASLSTYLLILKDAIERWNLTGSNLIFASPERRQATGEHAALATRRLLVVFPPGSQDVVESVLAEKEARS